MIQIREWLSLSSAFIASLVIRYLTTDWHKSIESHLLVPPEFQALASAALICAVTMTGVQLLLFRSRQADAKDAARVMASDGVPPSRNVATAILSCAVAIVFAIAIARHVLVGGYKPWESIIDFALLFVFVAILVEAGFATWRRVLKAHS